MNIGATLFCYGTEYARGQYDFEACVRAAYLAGAQGYEIVGSQMLPDYPNVSEEFLGRIAKLESQYGIRPVSYGANNDKGMKHNRCLTDDEMLADAIIDLKTAHQLGCKVMRAQYMLSPEAFEKLVDYAEIYDVKVGIEIHNPETPLSEKMKAYIAVIEKTKSPYLGLIPDLGCFAVKPNRPHWLRALEAGVKEEHLELAAEFKYKDIPVDEAREKLLEAGASPTIFPALMGMYGFVQFNSKEKLPQLLADLKEVLKYSLEIHCKFHYLDENDVEASIPYPEIIELFKQENYQGNLICEYEDELYCGGTAFTKQQIKMLNRLIKN
ncbi:MAG: TIM barrel protein [Lactovum sp.]